MSMRAWRHSVDLNFCVDKLGVHCDNEYLGLTVPPGTGQGRRR